MINVSQLIDDFSRFRDPATTVSSRESSAGAELIIVRDGQERRYFIEHKTGRVVRRSGETRKYINFGSLLASDEFASLDALRETQQRLMETKALDDYLEPAGSVDDNDGSIKKLNFDLFKKICYPATGEKLNCILIDGPAGVGKTSIIGRLTLARARERNIAPILHVTSKGRRLTNLRDALAGTISDLRAKFIPSEIPILVRYGLLQIALDGFDEFVDPDGYKDAWTALRDFMNDCGSAGPLLLAGRDTFFDQQKFRDQLDDVKSKIDVTNVRLAEVSPSSAKEWLKKAGWASEQLESTTTSNYLRPGSYILRPFFLSKIKNLDGWDQLKTSGQSPQSFIITSMLAREANILTVPLGLSSEKIIQSLSGLFEAIAEDMADREVDNISLEYLEFVAEVAFSGVLQPDRVARLKHSLGSLALLESANSGESVQFLHSEVQNRFLIRHLIQSLIYNKPTSFLNRIILGLDKMEAYAERILEISQKDANSVIDTIARLNSSAAHNTRLSDNTSALLITSFVRADVFDDTRILNNMFPSDVRLVAKFPHYQLRTAKLIDLT